MAGPLGAQRGDFHAALIAYTIAAVNRGKRGRKPKLSDFLLKWGKEERGEHEDGEATDPG